MCTINKRISFKSLVIATRDTEWFKELKNKGGTFFKFSEKRVLVLILKGIVYVVLSTQGKANL